ncbi:DinB family protein [Alkalicoccus chagannorensis]|uniref:DinB family protein n=1 Tax=Alkalicoccus chagannorensis TaxID=427072 RepID=UPI0004022C53|nr:DinB family protein [Alkalicoccus chagannorensis]
MTIERLQAMEARVKELSAYPEQTLRRPYTPGKWSPRDIIGHLYYWDRYLLDSMLPAVQEGAVLPPFPHDDVFNQAALASLEGRSASWVMEQFLDTREEVRQAFTGIGEDVTFSVRGSDEAWNRQLLVTMFADHDEHHDTQLAAFLDRERRS